jgi:hypothetical protein
MDVDEKSVLVLEIALAVGKQRKADREAVGGDGVEGVVQTGEKVAAFH